MFCPLPGVVFRGWFISVVSRDRCSLGFPLVYVRGPVFFRLEFPFVSDLRWVLGVFAGGVGCRGGVVVAGFPVLPLLGLGFPFSRRGDGASGFPLALIRGRVSSGRGVPFASDSF